MIEYLIVSYPRVRDVFISGAMVGVTNEIIRVRRGTMSVHLGQPIDYRPGQASVKVSDTTEDAPKIVTFRPK